MRSSLLLLLAALVAAACGDDDVAVTTTTAGGAGGLDDGLIRPEGNGIQITETEACARFESAFTNSGCPITMPKCPSLIRVIPGHDPDCVMYDEGAVQGCLDYFASQAALSCSDLQASQKSCVAVVYPGTEPAGCP